MGSTKQAPYGIIPAATSGTVRLRTRLQTSDPQTIIMAKKAITDRFRVTKHGKILRRPMGLSHSLANKRGKAIREKRLKTSLASTDARKIAKKYL